MITPEAARDLVIELEPVAAEQLVAGAPCVGILPLGHFGGHEYGVWEMTAGTMRDVEVDELFVVVNGAATVTFSTGESMELSVGSVGRMSDGDETEWIVGDRIRKVYIAE